MKQIIWFALLCGILTAQSPMDSQVDSSNVKSPGKALLFSVIPGGGQLYNRHPIKAALFAGAFTYFAYEYTVAQEEYQADISSETLHRSRNDKVWMMSLVWTLNILDAYVDAQLWDFNKYEIEDKQPTEAENPNKPEIIGNLDGTE
ncbi:MAG: hypothetical protein K9M55_09575 [Candidatus Marinimicrobia bacterium]|nr:hypothetical protein [Candidatus Neomarinimicrobiota bacterium]MCF7922936.1 hypothetical protein [Candidatus Neomarinimicrobiota bacterium]